MRCKSGFLAACGAMVAVSLAGRAAAQDVPGLLSLRQGTFRPLLRATRAPAGLPASGTIVVTYSITVLSSLAQADGVSCAADAIAYTESGNYFEVTATANATRSGGTAACTMTLPYSWVGVTTTDSISVTYSLYDRLKLHTSLGALALFVVPANGTTTNLSLATAF